MLRAEDRIGPYTLIRQLGKGSFGVVWLAERRGKFLTTQVALKIPIDEEPDLEAIQNEAQSWLQVIGHPNVLPVLDADEYDGQIVIASEYAPDGSLADWLRQHGGKAPSVQAAIEMECGVLSGLEHLHSRMVIHRDLKPGNVLLQGDTPRLTDFGVSRVLRTSGSTRVAGTPAYMAPEMFDGLFSEQTDIWAAGVLLYRMLTGALPFSQQGWGALYAAIKEDAYPPMPDEVPAGVCAVVARALQKEPSQRFESAHAMRLALQDAARAAPGDKPAAERRQNPPVVPDLRVERPPASGFDLQMPGVHSFDLPAVRSAAPPQIPALPPTTVPEPPSLPSGGRQPAETNSRFSFWPLTKNPPPMRLHEPDGAEMAWIAPGEFLMGDADQIDNPRRRVVLEGYWIYRCPVTVAMYRRFRAATKGTMPEPPPWGWIDDHPMVNVHWQDAVDYCKWARVSLPTEAQWEKAARGPDGRRFPWGNNWDPNRCRCSKNNYADAGSTGLAGAFPTGTSPYGVMDMAGNVWEWCHEMVDSGSFSAEPGSGPRHVLRGGSWEGNLPNEFRASFRQRQFPDYMYYTIGFRCVLNGEAP